ncbi:hypothetical protein PAMC26510_04065 [Caballeronia sordidicola]|uniref:Uncharacterized protein n=1 Tax=Caballeronia sordidicola TaxID=196367 RepID=A0A242N8I3_CABSO|nr:hypothetical protein PAMC26577_08785 [Caballeronia sordidicola]OTP79951.1 hypothetical protein PAMC26510_04065 [Caballeronia sordidicola]
MLSLLSVSIFDRTNRPARASCTDRSCDVCRRFLLRGALNAGCVV